MNIPLIHSKRIGGMTLPEMLMAMSIFSVAMAALVGASISLQMAFGGTSDYFTSEGDQLRVLDYFSTDMRRSLAYAVNSGTVTYGGTTYSNTIPSGATEYLTVVIQNYKDETVTPLATRLPTINSDLVSYGTTPVTVSYYLLGNSLYRVEVDPDLPAGDERNSPVDIADNVADFNITGSTLSLPLTTETIVSICTTFAPKYSRSVWTNSLSTTSTTDPRIGTTVGCKVQIRNLPYQ